MHALTAADLGQLRKLNELFAEAFHEREIYCSAPPHDGYVRDLLADRHTIVLVALADVDVAGGLVAYELRKFEQERCRPRSVGGERRQSDHSGTQHSTDVERRTLQPGQTRGIAVHDGARHVGPIGVQRHTAGWLSQGAGWLPLRR